MFFLFQKKFTYDRYTEERPEEISNRRPWKEYRLKVKNEILNLRGRADQIYFTDRNSMVLVEQKSGKCSVRVFENYLIQLSLYRYALVKQDKEVELYGYLRFGRLGEIWERVDLYDDQRCELIMQDYKSIIYGNKDPKPHASKMKCAKCSQAIRCQKVFNNFC